MDVDDDTELMILLSEQRRELTAAIAADSDLDFAFQLQMQEAIKASSTSQPSSSSSSFSNQPFLLLNEVTESPSGIASLVAEEIDKFERERSDRELVQEEARKMQENLDRLMHDQVFARQILDVPENEWRNTGDYLEKPYGLSKSSNEEVFRVYFKGLVSEETVMNVKMSFAGIGVAICDTRDCCVFELRKPFLLGGGGGIEGDVVELEALIEALNAAVTLGLKRVHIFCHSDLLYPYLTGKQKPIDNNVVILVDQLHLIQRKFTYCGPYLVGQNNVKFAFQFARDAIVSQVTKVAENTSGKTLFEHCTICLEYIYSGQMFSVNNCLHRYCFTCMRKHVEAKLLLGKLPECPHDGCKSELKIECCKKFLNPELYDIMSLRIKEASIPPAEKVYCPFSSCSALMSKTEVQEYSTAATSSSAGRKAGMGTCIRCNRGFCINCKVAWHDEYSCTEYKRRFPYRSANEAKLKTLATSNRWRECVMCKNLVELSTGCYHIYCRCGHEFCYTCGAEWIGKKPTCKCPIWDEHNIIYAHHQNRP